MTSDIDKIMEAMVASANQESSFVDQSTPTPRIEAFYDDLGTAAGSEILAILQKKYCDHNNNIPLNPNVPVFVPKPALGGGPIRDQNGNFLMYDREFLLDCSKSVAVKEMPRGLEDKLAEFPNIRRSASQQMLHEEMALAQYFHGQFMSVHENTGPEPSPHAAFVVKRCDEC